MEYIQSKMRKYITYRTFFDAKYNFVYYSKIYLHRCNLLVVTGNVTKKFGTWNRNQGKTERVPQYCYDKEMRNNTEKKS
jgi:hypothetical protein